MLVQAAPARAETPDRAVAQWVTDHAVPLSTLDPTAPLDDIAAVRSPIGTAQIVGLGESVHGAAQETTLKVRTLRLLVERLGFRSIAWEEDWTTGLLIDDYIRTGRGDLNGIIARMTGQWQSRPVADLLRWLRGYNAGRADKVRFVGVEYYYTGPEAYDAVEAHVARVAPNRLAALRVDLRVLRPTTETMPQYVQWYAAVADKRPYIRQAHDLYRIVAGVPHSAGDRAHALALHHARQIVSFYEHFNLPGNAQNVYRDARAAQNLRWWRQRTGDKIVYWAAAPHTAAAPDLRIVVPPGPDFRYPAVGSYLRRWYGDRYLSIWFTFDHGSVGFLPADIVTMPAPAPTWFEHPLGGIRLHQFALDLRPPAPVPVRRWLNASITTRGLPQAGPTSHITGGTAAQWFDMIIHVQVVTPLQPAPRPRP
jgi:erythromycin esterase